LTQMYRDGRLLRTHRAGESKLNAYLEDYAYLADGLLALYEATFDLRWFIEARSLVETMIDQNFGAVPVVEKDFTLVGLVSEFDLLRVMEEEKDLRQITAEEIMTRNVVTVTEEMLVKDLIKLLQERHLIRTPVIRGKALVGIVSRRDAVFGYVKATSKYWWPGKGGGG